jgi:hypothetical protein
MIDPEGPPDPQISFMVKALSTWRYKWEGRVP